MAKVYVSSTLDDLRKEREAVIKWLVAAGHQPVHSYRADSAAVLESCLREVEGCDLYVLILGHRYGWQPGEGNPGKLSMTHLEFRRAGERGIPRIALLRMNVPDVRNSDLQDIEKAKLVRDFDEEVRKAARSAEFHDLRGLIHEVSAGVLGELEKLTQRRVAALMEELERKNRLLDEGGAENRDLRDRIRELERAAVYRTVKSAEAPGAGEAAVAAVEALGAGDTRPAEALLRREEGEQAGRIGLRGADDAGQRSQAAALARELGALAMGHDVGGALAAFERAAEYEPEDFSTHVFIGDLRVLLGDLAAAMQSYERAYSLAGGRVARDPGNTEWQRDLSVGYSRIGNVLVAQGNGPGALAAYRRGLGIAEGLAARDPENTQWQRDLSVSHNKIGDVLVAQGDGRGALAAYRRDLEIAERLTARDPGNTKWQRDLWVSHNKIGEMLMAQGDGAQALAAYRQGFEIAEELATRDPSNTEWQRDLTVSYEKIGNVLLVQGDGPGALPEYRKALEIREGLAARDPENTVWQRDLSVSYEKIGDVLLAQGDGLGALPEYRKALEIREGLAARDAANAQWQVDLAVSCSKLGVLEHWLSKEERREYLMRGREILVGLKERGRLHPQQDWIPWFDKQIAKL